MTPITRQDILAHQTVVPWSAQYQVEQDLLLCRAMAALFNDTFLRSQIAMRGGTLLHKVHLAPASRYSEDIDLVVVGDRPEDHVRRAIRRVLADVLGPPKTSVWGTLTLAIRNAVKPSKILRMTYSLPSIIEPGRMLDIVVEANVTERRPHRAVVEMPFSFPFRDQPVQTQIKGYDLHEMLGTKMRAMFQRKRGRDLFDLYWALTKSPTPVGLGLVLGLEAGEGFGLVVKGVINAFATEEETVTQFHIHASSILPWRRFRKLNNSGRIPPNGETILEQSKSC